MNQRNHNRRNFLKKVAAMGAVVSFSNFMQATATKASAKPNIVLIMADDLGYECIGANGGTSYQTPVLDELARTGMRFEHCYSQPLCTPSRAQLMTGIYNVRNYIDFGVLDKKATTFAQLLKENGYATCIAGKWQLGVEPDSPQHFGFEQSCLWHHTRRAGRYPNPGMDINGKPVDYENGEYGPDVASDFICDFIESNKEKPFLVYYPMILTHCPFEPTPDSEDWDPESKGALKYKGNEKYFADMVQYMDKMVGKIIAKLDVLGLRENTVVLFVGDNGTDKPVVSLMNGKEVAGGKGKLTDAGTRVPLIANWPGHISEGKTCFDLVDFTDFLPTLCDAAGVAVPEQLKIDGHSFLPQLEGRKGNPRKWIYCWYSRNGGPEGVEWARNQRYKLYRTGDFYDISQDVLEKQPLSDLTPEAMQIRTMLQEALDTYKHARPERLRSAPKPK